MVDGVIPLGEALCALSMKDRPLEGGGRTLAGAGRVASCDEGLPAHRLVQGGLQRTDLEAPTFGL